MPRSESFAFREKLATCSATAEEWSALIANFNMANDGVLSGGNDRDREIQRMEREESCSNWIHKGCIGQIC